MIPVTWLNTSDQKLNLPPTCFPKPKFTYFAFKSSEIKYYLKDLNPHGGLDPHNIFPLFLNKMAVILAHKLAKIFCGLIAAGSLPALWRKADITAILKGNSPSQLP